MANLDQSIADKSYKDEKERTTTTSAWRQALATPAWRILILGMHDLFDAGTQVCPPPLPAAPRRSRRFLPPLSALAAILCIASREEPVLSSTKPFAPMFAVAVLTSLF